MNLKGGHPPRVLPRGWVAALRFAVLVLTLHQEGLLVGPRPGARLITYFWAILAM
jgi:hypothetical protein